MNLRPLSLLFVCVLLAGTSAYGDSALEQWTLDEGSAAGFTLVEGRDEGSPKSVAFSLDAPGTLVARSGPIALQVGHLYRVSGWIRTENALSDPTARYPTAVPATISMASFPFTNHAPAIGGTRDWTRVETLFFATQSEDRVRVHLGHNGPATGKAWFADIEVEKVDDIHEMIPRETVRWIGDAYRYDHKGWIFVHIEGEPYERGFQYGYLLADEIVAYMAKLGWYENNESDVAGWNTLRFIADATLLRKYDEEYLTEMKGIADGARRAGATFHDREIDLVDIVTLNSVVDIGQMRRAMGITPHALTGQSFLKNEEEMDIPDDEHSCSAFAATGPATKDGDVVFGQIFMWGGYTGVHWDVITDVVPSEGHRLVYHTFPGGIHSGADFYINEAGIVIGETTVSQTPFDQEGTPQSNRIRKAAQYASSIDEVAEILSKQNNGMYTNDWPIADVKSGEVAIFLLGTEESRLWRTGDDIAPFGLPGFLWANNNNRDPEVRKEYVAQPEDRPYDLVFSPWNRDVAFNEFYREHAGSIDAQAGVELWASSPVNRAHACDGKITTGEMAREMVFLAHYGKVTLREKFPEAGSRRMPDLPGAIPHLSLGYSVASPVFVTEALKAARAGNAALAAPASEGDEIETIDEEGVRDARLALDHRELWRRTVYPASDAESWFVSGSAAYWRILRALDQDAAAAEDSIRNALHELTTRYHYTVSREGDLVPLETARAYDRYAPYRIPRIKGVFALHQLRLALGTERFLAAMRAVHEKFAEREATTDQIIGALGEAAGEPVDRWIRPWIEREGLPSLSTRGAFKEGRDGPVSGTLTIARDEDDPPLALSVAIIAEGRRELRELRLDEPSVTLTFETGASPVTIEIDPFGDVPVDTELFYTWPNFIDDFHSTSIVYGTAQQIEANHTLARRFQETLADAYVEILPPLVKDAELDDEARAKRDLIVLGSRRDNAYIESIAERLPDNLPLELGPNWFRWQDETFARPDQGLFLVVPNPDNPQRALYLLLANSALQLHHMTESYRRGIPSWALFEGGEITGRGYHLPLRMKFSSSFEKTP